MSAFATTHAAIAALKPVGSEDTEYNAGCADGYRRAIDDVLELISTPQAPIPRPTAPVPDLLTVLEALDCPDILGCAESCASGTPRWDDVNRKIAAARAVIANAKVSA